MGGARGWGRLRLAVSVLPAMLLVPLVQTAGADPAPATGPGPGGVITTIAGTGTGGSTGDGGPAVAATLTNPIRAVQGPDGAVLIADEGNNVIRRIAPDGTIATVAGVAGPGSFGGDGGAATAAHLNQPTGVSPTPDGGFLIADRSNSRIRRVSAAGTITTVAGSGAPCANPAGTCGDGGKAVKAKLNGPDRVVPTSDGGYLVTEDQGNKVRKVSKAGVISTVAGTGTACAAATSACGDGAAATAAQLNGPNGVAPVPGGGFVISDSGDNRVRQVDAGGTITTIAGNGVAGSFGNNVVATNANLNQPSSVAVAPDGSVVIADTFSHLVRSVSAGKIHTIAGMADKPCPTSTSACGDGGAATSALLNTPYDVGVTADGMVLISDHLDNRVRRVDARLGGSPTIWVQDKQLVDGAGRPVQLAGVNRAAFESRCTNDTSGIADGPVDQTSVDAMLTWRINVVRLPITEDCWLGINGLPKSGTAASYQAAVRAYVTLLRRNGLYVIIDDQYTAPGTQVSNTIDYMPDADHMPTFWGSVAKAFKSDHGVIFDPINEVAMASWNNPHPTGGNEWHCWLKGCSLDSMYPGVSGQFAAAGLQSLVDKIRSVKATQPILLGGLSYNADLSQLATHLPTDSQHQLVASAHVYDFAEGNGIDSMFTNQLEPLAQKVPVILGELGEQHCDSGTAAYTSHVLSLVDTERNNGRIFGVLGWVWAAGGGWHCPTGTDGSGGPLLIRSYNGTATVMGNVIRTWIQARP